MVYDWFNRSAALGAPRCSPTRPLSPLPHKRLRPPHSPAAEPLRGPRTSIRRADWARRIRRLKAQQEAQKQEAPRLLSQNRNQRPQRPHPRARASILSGSGSRTSRSDSRTGGWLVPLEQAAAQQTRQQEQLRAIETPVAPVEPTPAAPMSSPELDFGRTHLVGGGVGRPGSSALRHFPRGNRLAGRLRRGMEEPVRALSPSCSTPLG